VRIIRTDEELMIARWYLAGVLSAAIFSNQFRACRRCRLGANVAPCRSVWNEIRHNAIKFSRDGPASKARAPRNKPSGTNSFRSSASNAASSPVFEESVKKISGDYGRIDLFWPGILLIEHKSFGEDLRKAETQAFQYIRDLANDPARRDEIPRYIIVSDFARIALHDLEPEEQRDLPLFDKKRGVTHEFSAR